MKYFNLSKPESTFRNINSLAARAQTQQTQTVVAIYRYLCFIILIFHVLW